MSYFCSITPKKSSMMFYSKYFVVALLLVLVSPAFAIDENEMLKKIVALNWQNEGFYRLEGTKTSLIIAPQESIVMGKDAEEFMKISEGHDSFKPDAVVWTIGGPKLGTLVQYQYFDEGFMELDDWGEFIDKDELLEEIKTITLEQNKIRNKSYPKLFVDKWLIEPKLVKEKAHVIFAFSGHSDKGTKFANARAIKLGRYGYSTITWTGSFELFHKSIEPFEPILAAYKFDDDSEYNDFVAGTDEVAALGIGALTYKLLTGKKASKTGLAAILATVAVFAKKFWFILLIPFIFVWKWILNLFKGNKNVR